MDARRPPSDRRAAAAPRRPGQLTTPAEAPVRWGLRDVLTGFVPAVLGGLALLAGGDDGDDPIALGTFVVGQLFVWLFLLGAPLLASYRRGRRDLAVDFGLAARPVDVPVGIGLGIVTQLVVGWLYEPLFRLWDSLDRDEVEEAARRVLDGTSGPGLVVLFVSIVVLAPVIEELFFRGLVLRYLRRHLSTGVAVFVSAVLFALSHNQLLTLPALTIFGVVAGLLAVRSGRLGPSIFLHVGFNLLTFVVLVATS